VNLDTVVSFHHKMAVKCCLEDDEIEKQLKCKICDVGLCIFGCFLKYHTKARFSYTMRACSQYIHQADNCKKCYVYAILLHLKIFRIVHKFLLAACVHASTSGFKYLHAQIGVLWPRLPY
jgi:hypothetical protein